MYLEPAALKHTVFQFVASGIRPFVPLIIYPRRGRFSQENQAIIKLKHLTKINTQMKKLFSLIAAIIIISCSTSSDENGNSTTTVVPIAPTNLIGTAASPTQINLSWTDNSTNETGFKIDRKIGSGNWVTDYGIVSNADVINYSDTSVSAGITYTYRVSSFNSVGKSLTYSNEVTLTPIAAPVLPILTTTAASSIANTTAVSGGTISSDGGAAVTTRGVCWSTSSNPTIALTTKTTNGNGTGAFTSSITGLTAGTTYYVRAYATNSVGTAYGNQLTITTTAASVLPTLITTAVSSITQTSSSSGGNISNDGGAAITTRGVCWSTSPNPTIALTTKTTNGAGTGAFTSNITGLTANTSYFTRAYATNSQGTAYGNEISFTTLQNSTGINIAGPNVTDIDGNVYASVTNCGQTFTKKNLNVSKYSDGTPIPQVTNSIAWNQLLTGAWCYYLNQTGNGPIIGKLYNWFAVAGIYDEASYTNPALRKKLAPTGWHVPSNAEWSSLINCFDPNANGGISLNNTAGGKMKATGTLQAGTGTWNTPNTDATNESGFTGLPAGFKYDMAGFLQESNFGRWWSSSESDFAAGNYILGYDTSAANRLSNSKRYGFSVRCVKD